LPPKYQPYGLKEYVPLSLVILNTVIMLILKDIDKQEGKPVGLIFW